MSSGIISSIDPESIAEEIGLLVGDELVSINGHKIKDIIDYRFYSAEEEVELKIRRNGEPLYFDIEKDFDDPLGVDFDEELFDGIRKCGNACIFCFVNQLPRGMRKSLYVKDDDYRLSFLHGNFVTLANITKSDIKRIIEQRLSPLYVSVHTTDPDLRAQMLGTERGAQVMEQLSALAEGRITLHTQIVACPGINDGEHLDRTISDLAGFYPAVASIAAVPVGLTAHRRGHELGSYDEAGARCVVQQVKGWQKRFLKEKGERLVFASDEFYLRAGETIPSARAYEGFPQIENGVGLVRQFLDDEKRVLKLLPEKLDKPMDGLVVTGKSSEPLILEFLFHLTRIQGLGLRLAPVENDFFGRSVTVTGLLTGQDIAAQLKPVLRPGDIVFLPSICLREGAFLDDWTLEQLEKALECKVIPFHPSPSGLMKAILCHSVSGLCHSERNEESALHRGSV